MHLGALAGPQSGLTGEAASAEITGLSADSREIAPGYLFAALPGTLTDGARFIPSAVANGAAALLLPEGCSAERPQDIPIIEDPNPRRRLALMAARFFGAQPEVAVAVTGTNGKTSVATFVRQIWQGLGHRAASLGTLGVASGTACQPLPHTTPEPVALHRLLAELARDGVTHVALEASSHGLQQHRVDGVGLNAAAFTNISRDHLDYHDDFDAYLAQKLRLFRELLPDGAPVVIDADAEGGAAVHEIARERCLRLLSVGRLGETLALVDVRRQGFSQQLTVRHGDDRHEIRLPLVGGFQSSNALVAAALCMGCRASADEVLPLLERLEGATGRLELAGVTGQNAHVFIDYSHTPDALANALAALRPYAENRLIVVFGCGGDRDPGKRPEMGAAARDGADLVYVTDDNPRSEDPAAIRAAAMAAVPGGIDVADRREAIGAAIDALGPGDVLLVAGKGHETGQTIGDRVVPFSDHEVVREALAAETADV
ncbi:MAG: UDP-N-acetylmuramoyl-L-alanyl-D-glutamate--2,6-diaminopimelate ligase [Methyloligellaceae bacterium]